MIEIPFWTAELIFAAIWLVCRIAVWIKRGSIDRKREALLMLMFVNLAVIIRFTFFEMATVNGKVQPLLFDANRILPFKINAVPLVNLFDYESKRELLLNVIGNTAMFIPSGIVLPALYKKLRSFGKTVAAGALISLCIEILQLPLFTRTTDIDDLILNTLGVAIGYGIYALARAIGKRKEDAK